MSDSHNLGRLNLTTVPLYLYEKVILKKDGTLFLGDVVSYMPINDWAELHGYLLTSYETRRYASAGETTKLISRPLRGSAASDGNRNTMAGLARETVPSMPMHRATMMGIPLPARLEPRSAPTACSEQQEAVIQPMPIKIIG